jgi:3-oxoacyl-[acyl-carrier-protein] synthase II
MLIPHNIERSALNTKRIVITGMGSVSSVGKTVPELWDSLTAGRSGIDRLTHVDVSEMRTKIGGEIKNFEVGDYLDAKDAKRLDPFCHYAWAAAKEALSHADLSMDAVDPTRVGVVVGSGVGGLKTIETQIKRFHDGGPRRVSPFLVPMMISDMASGCISIQIGAQGPNFGHVSACATGSHSIGEAFWILKRGDADVILAGGAEAATHATIGIAGFCAAKAMSTNNDNPQEASRPFDKNRDGFVIADGAGVLVMETLEHAQARGAEILAEMVGYGSSGDAYHITSPHPEGDGAARAVKACLNHAGLNTTDVDYVNAHGTSTQLNDKYETLALKSVFGDAAKDLLISSTKSLTGHALGAAGGIEAITSIMAIRTGQIPGTWNYETPDPDCDLNYLPNQTLEKDIDVAISENFGFGGHNAVVAFRKFNG